MVVILKRVVAISTLPVIRNLLCNIKGLWECFQTE